MNGFKVKVQDAGCVTVKFCVPTLIVPDRDAPVLLGAAVYCTDPFAAPEPVAVSHEAFDVADQLHPLVTLNDPLPPAAATVALPGVRL